MFIRVSKRKLFPLILFFNMLLSSNHLISQLDEIGSQRAFFSMHASPDRSTLALTNSNYTSLDIIEAKGSIMVDIPNINSFQCKWSPDSEKLMVMRSVYERKRRENGLIVINKMGAIDHTVIELTDQNIYPIGWTGNNTIHYLLDSELMTQNIKGSKNEWDIPLIYAIKNKLYKKTGDLDTSLLYEANDMILNLSYSSDARLITFEVYGNNTMIIKNSDTVIDDIGNGNAPKVSPDGNMVIFMVLEDDGYQITSGDIYLWDSKTGNIDPVANDPEKIEMNPIWISDHSFFYIDLNDGSVNEILLEEH